MRNEESVVQTHTIELRPRDVVPWREAERLATGRSQSLDQFVREAVDEKVWRITHA